MLWLAVLLAYLLGSLNTGIVVSRLRGADIRERDLPGSSGTYRQYGLGAAVLVAALDLLRGVLAGWLALRLSPELTWPVVAAVVAGHCYPVFFRFDGGGGIAPMVGALLVINWRLTLLMVAVALLLLPLYRATLQARLGLNAVPAVSAVMLPVGLLLGWRLGGWPDLLAAGVVMLLRAAHLMLRTEPPARAS